MLLVDGAKLPATFFERLADRQGLYNEFQQLCAKRGGRVTSSDIKILCSMLQVVLDDCEINSLLSAIASAAQAESASYVSLANLQDFLAGILKCQRASSASQKSDLLAQTSCSSPWQDKTTSSLMVPHVGKIDYQCMSPACGLRRDDRYYNTDFKRNQQLDAEGRPMMEQLIKDQYSNPGCTHTHTHTHTHSYIHTFIHTYRLKSSTQTQGT
jgi:hypothetical protein